MSSSKPRGPIRLLLSLVLFGLVFGGVAEVWLRTVMPAAEKPVPYQAQPSTIWRHDPNGQTTGVYTVGRRCLHGGAWHINNAGWNSAVDYQPAAERSQPMIAIFGDSFIDGFDTDVDEHVDAYLPQLLPGTDAYAFGAAGWYLEQYVAVSRYVAEQYRPDLLVIVIDDGDVTDSLSGGAMSAPYFWHIDPSGHSFDEVAPSAAYRASLKVQLVKKSALVNYLYYNAELTLPGINRPVVIAPPSAGAGAPPDGAWRDLVPPARVMVAQLVRDHPRVPIVFAVHGDRYLPVQGISHTPMSSDCRAVQAAALGQPQCSVIDLRYAFSRDWAENHVRFEAADGFHWNAHASHVVAQALADFISRKGLLAKGK